jgi:hypothetical protein
MLKGIIVEQANKKKPMWRRVLGGTMFNYETQPLPDRVARCNENIAKAGMLLLVKYASG